MRCEFDQGGSPITIGVLAIIGAMAGGTILATTMGTAAGVIGVIFGALGGAVLGWCDFCPSPTRGRRRHAEHDG